MSNYSKEKLSLAKQRYLKSIEEAVTSIRLLEILEQAGGQLNGLEVVKRLMETQAVKSGLTPEQLCIELEIPAEELISLSDEMLDYGLWSSL